MAISFARRCFWLQRHQPAPDTFHDRFGAALGAELGKDGGDVVLHGVFADAEGAGDRLVRKAGRQGAQDFAFALRQRLACLDDRAAAARKAARGEDAEAGGDRCERGD